MKLGIVSAILPNLSFSELIEYLSKTGFESVELAAWPVGKASRRYAGVTHLNVDELDSKASEVQDILAKNKVEISALGYYPNTMSSNLEERKQAVDHLKKLIVAADKLGINQVSTFIGRMQEKNVEENLAALKDVWGPIMDLAEKHNVRVAIENCPMLFGPDQWPGGQNLFTTPPIWREIFSILDSKLLGINYDPSHFIWQKIDYLRPIQEFKDRIQLVHFKDIKLYPDKLEEVGTMAYPLDYMSPKIPGFGDIDWAQFVCALRDIGYDGHASIEVEDKTFEGSEEDVYKSVEMSYRYMRQYVR